MKGKKSKEKEKSRFFEQKAYLSKSILIIYHSVLKFKNTMIHWLEWSFAACVEQPGRDSVVISSLPLVDTAAKWVRMLRYSSHLSVQDWHFSFANKADARFLLIQQTSSPGSFS